jgi:hypothetical protein
MTLGAIVSFLSFQFLVPLLFAISVVAFSWGACLNIVAGSRDDELSDRGKTVMLYGLLALLVTMVLYGLLSLLRAEFS